MIIKYKTDNPSGFSEKEKGAFLELLKKQGQVKDPNLEKINSSSFLCLTYADKTAIGIGALKNVYITRMLLTKVADKNLFATTELNQSNTILPE